MWAILKGSKKKDVAWDFIAFSTSTKPLADQAKYIPYGPVRKSSAPLVGCRFLTGRPNRRSSGLLRPLSVSIGPTRLPTRR